MRSVTQPAQDELTVPATATRLGISEKTVHRKIDTQKLEAREEFIGDQRRRFVKLASIEAYEATRPKKQTEST